MVMLQICRQRNEAKAARLRRAAIVGGLPSVKNRNLMLEGQHRCGLRAAQLLKVLATVAG